MRINKSILDVQISATLAINERCLQLKNEGKEIFHFGFGQSPFPIPDLLIEQLIKHGSQKNYEHVQGLLPLREAIHGYYKRRKLDFAPRDIFIGAGTKPLLHLIQFILDQPLILPVPSWVSYRPQAALLKKEIHNIDCSSNQKQLLTAEQLDTYCVKHQLTQCILLLNYPSNPLGTTYREDELMELANIARKHKLTVLSDEIYGDYTFNTAHASIASYYPEGTIVTNGLSKWCGAGGWRLGALMIPKRMDDLAQSLRVVISETYSCVTSPIQYAAISAFQESEVIINYKRDCVEILRRISDFVHHELRSVDPSLPTIEGGFYSFPSFKNYTKQLIAVGIHTDVELCNYLLEELQIAVLPGRVFGVEHTMSIRLSFVDFNGAVALDRLSACQNLRTEQFVEAIAPNVFHGMKKLTNWIQSI